MVNKSGWAVEQHVGGTGHGGAPCPVPPVPPVPAVPPVPPVPPVPIQLLLTNMLSLCL